MKTKKPITIVILLLLLGTVLLSSGVYFCLKPELYRATCQIRVNRDILPALEETNVDHDPYFIQTAFEIIQSETVLDKAINKLDLNTAWAQTLGHSEKLKTSQSRRSLRNRLELRPVQNTNLVELSICSNNKAEAANIANAIAEAYRDYRQTQYKERSMAATKVQEAQLDEVKGKIDKLEEALAAIAKESATAAGVAAPAIHHEQPHIEAEAEYLKAEKILNELKTLTPEELRQAIPGVAPDEILARLLQERTSAENQLIALGQELEESDPDLLRATQTVASLDSQIDERIQGILQGMQVRITSLKTEVENAAVKIEEVNIGITNTPGEKNSPGSHQSIRLAYELRDLQHARDVLEVSLSKLPATKSPQVEITGRAEPPIHPVFPNLAAGILLLVLGIITDGAGLRLLNRGTQHKIQPSAK